MSVPNFMAIDYRMNGLGMHNIVRREHFIVLEMGITNTFYYDGNDGYDNIVVEILIIPKRSDVFTWNFHEIFLL